MNIPQALVNGLKGFVMGASDVVPGVSGGTMALILGIYERLLHSLKSFDGKAFSLLKKRNFKQLLGHVDFVFLISIVIGMGIAIMSLSHPLSWLLENHPAYLWAFFFGLVIASVMLLRKRVKCMTLGVYGICIIGIGLGYWVVGLVPGQTTETPLLFFLSGLIAICAMMLPGISGSFLLVILGKYEQVLEAVRATDVVTLLPFAFGAFVGLFAFAKILSWLLKKYHDAVLALLIGLMIGSLRKIWPWQDEVGVGNDFYVVLMIAAGALVVLGLHKLSEKK